MKVLKSVHNCLVMVGILYALILASHKLPTAIDGTRIQENVKGRNHALEPRGSKIVLKNAKGLVKGKALTVGEERKPLLTLLSK